MSDLDKISRILSEIAVKIDALELKFYEHTASWTMLMNEEVLLYLDHDPGRDMIVISGDVADPPASARAQRYELLMQYNNQWAETGGIRMALDGPSGTIVQIADIPAAGLKMVDMQTILTGFTETLATWRQMLESEIQEVAKPLNSGGDENMIRV